MTPIFRIIIILVSILATFVIMKKIRDAKVEIEESVFWIFFSTLLLVFSVFPGVADVLSDLAGTYSTANFIFLLMIFLLLVKVFFMSVRMSQMDTKMKELVQQIALEEHKRREESNKRVHHEAREDTE